MDELLNKTETKMNEIIANMEKRFANVRAGRATPALVDGIMVDYYGNQTPLKHMANISVPEARELMIAPYDKSALGAIEKAIYEANIGLTPNNNGNSIMLVIPQLTEDTRKQYVKDIKGMAEETRIALRNARQDAMNEIKKSEMTDDEKDSEEDDIQKLIEKMNKLVEDKTKAKENELMSI